jgi:hypothetical protein
LGGAYGLLLTFGLSEPAPIKLEPNRKMLSDQLSSNLLWSVGSLESVLIQILSVVYMHQKAKH